MNWLLKSVLRILICVAIGVELIGCFCINSLMFHPVRHYDASYPGYVDIGTDGTKIAAVTIGPKKGKKAILYCHGNAEDMTDSLELLLGFASRYCDTITNRNLHYGNGCCGLGRTIKSLEDM